MSNMRVYIRIRAHNIKDVCYA